MMVINRILWRRASNIGDKGLWVPQLSCTVQITSGSLKPSCKFFSGRSEGEYEGNAEEALRRNDS